MLSQKIKRKKVELSLDQKREICNFFNNNTSIKQTQLILKFNNQFNMLISKSTMSDLIRNREKYTATENLRPIGTKRLRPAQNPMLEEALWMWLTNKASFGLSISADLLVGQAKKFGEELGIGMFNYSNGWLSGFKKRHNLSSYKIQGERESVVGVVF